MNKRFAVVDIETTGGLSKRDKIIEIAVVVLENDQVVDKFESLINPGRSIPPNITRITGIDSEMVADAPQFYEVAKRFVELTESAIFVAHNVRFDYSFIQRAYRELGYTFSRRQLCTHTLSRKIFPELRSHSLSNLIRHFDIHIDRRHRALDDALAAAQVLLRVLKKKDHFDTIYQLVNYGVKESQLPPGITIDRLHDLPDACGIYYLHNQFGDVVYVGKSINIRKRIMEHFADSSEKSAKLHRSVRDISFEVTGSELIALLHESDQIKKLKPFLNKALRRKYYNYAWVLDRSVPYFSIELKRIPVQVGMEVIAEFPKLRYARMRLKEFVVEHRLCQLFTSLEKSAPCYYRSLGTCLGACTGDEPADTYNDRLLSALDRYNHFSDRDFLLLEDGRTPDERAAIWIEDGRLKAYGYLPADIPISAACLEDNLAPFPDTQDSTGIISAYIHKKKSLEIIDL